MTKYKIIQEKDKDKFENALNEADKKYDIFATQTNVNVVQGIGLSYLIYTAVLFIRDNK